jgi:hypothetical protein
MLRIIFCFSLLSVLYACSSESDFEYGIETVYFKTDLNFVPEGFSHVFIGLSHNDRAYFVEDNPDKSVFIFYEFIQGKDSATCHYIKYPSDWDIYNVKRIAFKDLDDFYVLLNAGIIYWFKNGSIQTRIDLNNYLGDLRIRDFSLPQNNEFCLRDNKLLLPIFTTKDSILPNGKPYLPETISFDLSSNEVELSSFQLPEYLYGKNLGLFEAMYQNYTKKDTVIYWHTCDTKVYLSSGSKVYEKYLRSKYQENEFKSLSVDGSPENRDEYFLQSMEQGYYPYLVFNKFTNKYYRVFVHPVSRSEYFEKNKKSGGVSVMVLDHKLNLETEVLLDKNIDRVFVVVPYYDGLLLNTSRGYAGDDEKTIKFNKLKLIDKVK